MPGLLQGLDDQFFIGLRLVGQYEAVVRVIVAHMRGKAVEYAPHLDGDTGRGNIFAENRRAVGFCENGF